MNILERPKQKSYSAVLAGEEDRCYWFDRVIHLFRLEKMTTLDQENAIFVFRI